MKPTNKIASKVKDSKKKNLSNKNYALFSHIHTHIYIHMYHVIIHMHACMCVCKRKQIYLSCQMTTINCSENVKLEYKIANNSSKTY